jgi:hypothetical protein
MGMAPADMARLPHLIIAKKYFFVVSDLVHQLRLGTPTLNLALQGKLSIFD